VAATEGAGAKAERQRASKLSGERFGDARLLEAIGRRRDEPLGEGVADLLGEIAQCRGGERAQDDSSILDVELAPVPNPGGLDIQHGARPEAVPTVAEPALR
jgi:hypothetical protein